MACQVTHELQADGTWLPRYKNLIGDKISHRPRLLMQWGRWVCISHNARGEGTDGTLRGAQQAWRAWRIKVEGNKRREREHKAARPWLWNRK